MRIGKRLEKILDIIETGLETILDIGTDHGFLALKMLEQSKAKKVIATDISAGSLKKATDLAKKYNLTDSFKTMLSDGFINLNRGEYDLAVVAGMGGNEIVKILKNKPNGVKLKSYILQPMQDREILREYLIENGYDISFDETVKDKGKFYSVIKCCLNSEKKKTSSLKDRVIGITDEKNKGADFLEFVEFEVYALLSREKYLSEVDKQKLKIYNEFLLEK